MPGSAEGAATEAVAGEAAARGAAAAAVPAGGPPAHDVGEEGQQREGSPGRRLVQSGYFKAVWVILAFGLLGWGLAFCAAGGLAFVLLRKHHVKELKAASAPNGSPPTFVTEDNLRDAASCAKVDRGIEGAAVERNGGIAEAELRKQAVCVRAAAELREAELRKQAAADLQREVEAREVAEAATAAARKAAAAREAEQEAKIAELQKINDVLIAERIAPQLPGMVLESKKTEEWADDESV